MEQVFAVRQVWDKYLPANGKSVFWAFMDLEKAYDMIDRHDMWQMLRVYGVGGKLLKAVQSFHVEWRACARVWNDVSGIWLMLGSDSLCDVSIIIIIIIIIKRGRQCKAGRERLTPYQSEDPNPTTPTHRKKEEKGKTVGDKNGASS